MSAAVLGLAWCSLFACGSEDPASSAATDEARIRDLFTAYSEAFDEGDFAEVCELQTKRFTDELLVEAADAVGDGTSCADALQAMAAGGAPRQRLRDVEVDGRSARGRVGSSTWRFTLVGDEWKVAHAN
jgi:hypothetical protein